MVSGTPTMVGKHDNVERCGRLVGPIVFGENVLLCLYRTLVIVGWGSTEGNKKKRRHHTIFLSPRQKVYQNQVNLHIIKEQKNIIQLEVSPF